MRVSVQITAPLPLKQIDSFMDRTVYHTARITLDRTQPHIPRLTGDMSRDIIGHGVTGSNKSYALGWVTRNYAPYVWNYPQNTNWTNPASYTKWFETEFRYAKESIVNTAVRMAL